MSQKRYIIEIVCEPRKYVDTLTYALSKAQQADERLFVAQSLKIVNLPELHIECPLIMKREDNQDFALIPIPEPSYIETSVMPSDMPFYACKLWPAEDVF